MRAACKANVHSPNEGEVERVSQLEVVVGGAWGSEGKGAIAAWLAQPRGSETLVACRVAGPNAGHTVIGDKGADTSQSVAPNLCEPIRKTDTSGHPVPSDRFAWRLRQVPVAAITNPAAVLVIAAGSEIDLPILLNEVASLDAAGYDVSSRLLVDSSVTVIHDEHKAQEKYGRNTAYETVPTDAEHGIATKIGSTGKGIGAARADRLWRVPQVCLANDDAALDTLHAAGVLTTDTAMLMQGMLRAPRGRVLIEGTQGYGLGLHARDGSGELFYPYATASDCRAIDFLAMAGISPWQHANGSDGLDGRGLTAGGSPSLAIWLCLRPYPIRVGGNSGPMRNETDWASLGLPVEHTTVTGKVRRVAQWDGALARRAIQANGGPSPAVKVAMTMMDTIVPEVAGWTGPWPEPIDDSSVSIEEINGRLRERLEFYQHEVGCQISAIGTGPDTVLSLDPDSDLRGADRLSATVR